MDDLLQRILTARVYDVAERTPLDDAPQLSARTGNLVWLKREDLQPVFSFKIRGAYNKIAHLTPEERAAGVVCASAGNHAQGVAYGARKLGIEATIVMPRTTPEIKVGAVRRYGAQVVLEGESYSDCEARARDIAEERGAAFVHPFDDPLVIAGQGTCGREIADQCPDVDYVFVPVGGGGLIGGVAAYLKQIKPGTKVIGVEPVDNDAMRRSILAGERVELDRVGLFADGVAVKRVGKHTFDLVREYVDEIITVSVDEICSAIQSVYEDTRAIVEPAGALGVAGLEKFAAREDLHDKNLVAINSGANMNFERLQFVAERTLIGRRLEALFAITIDENAGSMRQLVEQVVRDNPIREFGYRLSSRQEAHIFLGVSTKDAGDAEDFEAILTKFGYSFINITANELAKEHIRHFMGGRAREAKSEVLYRFNFPERPYALTDFVSAMSSSWNISLLHYRGQGGDFGRVLMGFEIPEGEQKKFEGFLDETGYRYFNESENPAYRYFLR